ncbi:MAG: hypothetical protein EZS28_040356, partial [Streblomastix strix]
MKVLTVVFLILLCLTQNENTEIPRQITQNISVAIETKAIKEEIEIYERQSQQNDDTKAQEEEAARTRLIIVTVCSSVFVVAVTILIVCCLCRCKVFRPRARYYDENEGANIIIRSYEDSDDDNIRKRKKKETNSVYKKTPVKEKEGKNPDETETQKQKVKPVKLKEKGGFDPQNDDRKSSVYNQKRPLDTGSIRSKVESPDPSVYTRPIYGPNHKDQPQKTPTRDNKDKNDVNYKRFNSPTPQTQPKQLDSGKIDDGKQPLYKSKGEKKPKKYLSDLQSQRSGFSTSSQKNSELMSPSDFAKKYPELLHSSPQKSHHKSRAPSMQSKKTHKRTRTQTIPTQTETPRSTSSSVLVSVYPSPNTSPKHTRAKSVSYQLKIPKDKKGDYQIFLPYGDKDEKKKKKRKKKEEEDQK